MLATLTETWAQAFEVSVDASSQLQLYAIRSPWGAPTLSRQRLTHQLGLDVYGARPKEFSDSKVTWSFHSRLRMDGDYGLLYEEQAPNYRESFIPGLSTSPVDLAYASLDIDGLFRDTTSLVLGRQIVFNELGFWSFDGAKVAFSPGRLFELAAYGGFEQRGGMPLLSTARYERDGVFRGDRDGMSTTMWPGYLSSNKAAPALGASLALTAFRGIRARADYRRVSQSDRVVTLPFADETGRLQTYSGSRISSERFGTGVGFDLGQRGAIDGAYVYDLYRRTTQEHRLQAVYRLGKKVRMRAGYQYRLPLFDADSIFNWFGAKGNLLAQSSVSIDLMQAYQITVTGGVRWLGVGPVELVADGVLPSRTRGVDGLFRIDQNYVRPSDLLGTATHVEVGDAGRRFSTDIWYERCLWDEVLNARLLVSAGRYQHPLLPERAQSSALYVASVRVFPGGRKEFGTEWEHVLAEGPRQRFRVVATAQVRWP